MSKNYYSKNPQKNIKNNSEIAQGIKLLAHKRSEFEFNNPQYRPQIISGSLSKLKTVINSSAALQSDHTNQPGEIKIYPVILLAAIQSRLDIAARAWSIARYLDCAGTGWIYCEDLVKYLHDLGIDHHKQHRWIVAAVSCGLLFKNKYQNKSVYRIAGITAAAKIFGADHRGYPVLIPVKNLINRHWHAHVWGGYLATRSNRPISQLKLSQLTGITARAQKKYQKLVPVNKKRNYCQTNLNKSHLTGLREIRPSSFVGYKNKIYFRLPDSITVPESTAKRPPKHTTARVDNSRKKSHSKLLCSIGQDKSETIRLFHKSYKSAKSTIVKLDRLDLYPWNRPQELFIKKSERQTCNIWIMQSTTN